MEKKINNVLMFTGKDGSQLVYRVLFTYYSERFEKDYAVFYNEADENDLLAFSFTDSGSLSEPESPEEYKDIEQAVIRFDEENEKQ